MKKKVNLMRNGYFLLSSAVAIIAMIIVFNAPNTIPIHYDLNGIAAILCVFFSYSAWRRCKR